jgi:hypothetical protein
MTDEYIEKLKAARQFCKEQLESKGIFVEENPKDFGLSISLTSLGLSAVFATLTQEEIEYIVDNEVEL